jgi:hypothetical protein
MSNSLLSFVLLDNPATPDMSAVAEVLHARHPELAGEQPAQQARANSPLIRCGNDLVAVMSMPAPIPHDQGLWAGAATTWPESKAVAGRHRGHLIVSTLGKGEQSLLAARITTAVIGALIETLPEACGVVWAGRVARPAELWVEMSRESFAPFPDYPFRLGAIFFRSAQVRRSARSPWDCRPSSAARSNSLAASSRCRPCSTRWLALPSI